MRYLDDVPDHEAIHALEAMFPGWHRPFRQGKGVWLNSCFVSHRETGDVVEGEDWQDLRDQMRRYEARRTEGSNSA